MKKLLAVLAILCFGVMASACGGNDVEPQEPQVKQEQKETEAVETTLGAGVFYVGEDIPAGRYVITPGKNVPKDRRGIIEIYNKDEEDYDMSEMLDSTGDIGVSSITYDLLDGQKIVISSIDEVLFTPKD